MSMSIKALIPSIWNNQGAKRSDNTPKSTKETTPLKVSTTGGRIFGAKNRVLHAEAKQSPNQHTINSERVRQAHEATLEASSGVWGVPRGDKGSDFARIAQAIRPHLHIQAPLSPLGETNKASGAKEAEGAFNDNADSAKSTKETTPHQKPTPHKG